MLELAQLRVYLPLLRHTDCGIVTSLMEHAFSCPNCGQEISMVLDLSIGRQSYVEDCEVCCRPIEIGFTVEDDELASFNAKALG
jgi:transcription elongation factor Elf1